jgi:hypothetical protein
VLYASGLVVEVQSRRSSRVGCYSNFKVCVQPSIPHESLIGLLGTPNENTEDDWMDTDGNTLSVPTSLNDRIGDAALEYSSTNWCIDDVAEAVFSYEADLDFDYFSDCGPFAASPPYDFSSASSELVAICQGSITCLIDGLAFGLEMAHNSFEFELLPLLPSQRLRHMKGNPSLSMAIILSGTLEAAGSSVD